MVRRDKGKHHIGKRLKRLLGLRPMLICGCGGVMAIGKNEIKCTKCRLKIFR